MSLSTLLLLLILKLSILMIGLPTMGLPTMILDMKLSTIVPRNGCVVIIHTKSIEGIWSHLKRSIVGSYHKVSVKHLDSYLDELEWRFNNRDNPYLFRDTLLKLLQSDNFPYKELTSS